MFLAAKPQLTIKVCFSTPHNDAECGCAVFDLIYNHFNFFRRFCLLVHSSIKVFFLKNKTPHITVSKYYNIRFNLKCRTQKVWFVYVLWNIKFDLNLNITLDIFKSLFSSKQSFFIYCFWHQDWPPGGVQKIQRQSCCNFLHFFLLDRCKYPFLIQLLFIWKNVNHFRRFTVFS